MRLRRELAQAKSERPDQDASAAAGSSPPSGQCLPYLWAGKDMLSTSWLYCADDIWSSVFACAFGSCLTLAGLYWSEHAALPGQAGSLGAGRRWQAAASVQEHGQLAPPVPVPDLNFAVDQFFAVGEARLQCCLPSAACECLGSYQTALYRLHTGVVPPAWCSCIADMRDGQVLLVSDALTYLIS